MLRNGFTLTGEIEKNLFFPQAHREKTCCRFELELMAHFILHSTWQNGASWIWRIFYSL